MALRPTAQPSSSSHLPRFEIEAVLDRIAGRRCDSEHMIGGPDRGTLPAHPYRPIKLPATPIVGSASAGSVEFT
jgi:hypothetical protein